eukprot:NODE_50_length_27150_cov_0.307308.p6 type:complete len:328 gc:universal NODE_50_length_27150_cov_0.307308:18693-19676(+)
MEPGYLDIISDQKNQIKDFRDMLKAADDVFDEEMNSKLMEWEMVSKTKQSEIDKYRQDNKGLVEALASCQVELSHLMELSNNTHHLESAVLSLQTELDMEQRKRMLESSEHIRTISLLESEYQIKIKMVVERAKVETQSNELRVTGNSSHDLASKYQELCILYDRTTKKAKDLSQELKEAKHQVCCLQNDLDLSQYAAAQKTIVSDKCLGENKAIAKKFSNLELKIAEMHKAMETSTAESLLSHKASQKTIFELQNTISALQLVVDARSSASELRLKAYLEERREMEVVLVEAMAHVKSELDHDLTGEWHENEKILKYVTAEIKHIN